MHGSGLELSHRSDKIVSMVYANPKFFMLMGHDWFGVAFKTVMAIVLVFLIVRLCMEMAAAPIEM